MRYPIPLPSREAGWGVGTHPCGALSTPPSVSVEAMWGRAAPSPSSPERHQAEEPELPPLPSSKEKPLWGVKEGWEGNLTPTPTQAVTQQCPPHASKARLKEASCNRRLSKPRVSQYPQCPGFNQKSLVIPKPPERSQLNEK